MKQFPLTHPIISNIKKYTAEDMFQLLSHIHHILRTRVLTTNMPPKYDYVQRSLKISLRITSFGFV